MSISCPVDGKDDQIQSVPALVTGGRSSGSFSGPSGGVTYIDGKYGYTSGSTHLYGSLTSDIARALAAPLPPNKMRFWSFVGWSWLFLFSICILIGPFLVWPHFKESVIKKHEDQVKVFTSDITIICVLLLCIGWHPFAWLFIPSLIKKLDEKSEYARRYRLWQEKYTKWEKLFYCHRCGIFFNPETNEYYQPSQLYEYLRTQDYE